MEIKVDEIRTNYLVLGQGSPFLILHGWGSNSLKWQETGKILKEKGFKVIVPDLPGFGKSEEPKKPWSIKDYSQWLLHFMKLMRKNFIFSDIRLEALWLFFSL